MNTDTTVVYNAPAYMSCDAWVAVNQNYHAQDTSAGGKGSAANLRMAGNEEALPSYSTFGCENGATAGYFLSTHGSR